MGKRSDFERVPRDFYPTPYEAVVPLWPHVEHLSFIEPCAGDGALIRHLESFGMTCLDAFDTVPAFGIEKEDALTHLARRYQYVTNPPRDRKILHPLIENLLKGATDLWLLLDADWMHTKQAKPYLKNCSKIVSVGRIKWIPDSKTTGKDNCCWYQFKPEEQETVFIPRT